MDAATTIEEVSGATVLDRARTRWTSPWMNKKAIIGLSMVLAIALLGLVGRLFWDVNLARAASSPLNLPPFWVEGGSPAHPLGSENSGRDMLALLISGAPATLEVGLMVGLVGMGAGTFLGLAGGYLGGAADYAIRILSDTALTIPSLAILIVIASYIRGGLTPVTMAFIVALFAWAGPARLIRAQVLSMREQGYVRMARLSALPARSIMFREMMPNLLPYLAASFVGATSGGILAAVGLEALGLGPQRIPTLGMTLYFALQSSAILRGMWWWWGLPTAVLIIIFTGLFLVTVGLDEITNPRLRGAAGSDRAEERESSQAMGSGRPRAVPPDGAAPTRDGGGLPNAVLDVADLHVHYATPAGHIIAVNGVSLDVRQGETVGLVGESGSGKSTMAMAILRLISPPGRIVAGEIRINGQDITSMPEASLRRKRWQELSLIPQASMNALNPLMRVKDQIGDAIAAHDGERGGHEMRRRILELLELVHLPARVYGMYPHELSGGMKQRVCIATAIALRPPLIIADEPTSALDVVVQRTVAQTLMEVKRQMNCSMLLIGHDMALQAQLVDRIAVMHAGNIVELASVAELFDDPRHPYTRHLIRSVPSIRRRAPLVVEHMAAPDLRVPRPAPLLRSVGGGHLVADEHDAGTDTGLARSGLREGAR